MAIDDSNFESYLRERLGISQKALADWREWFAAHPYYALTKSDAIFGHVAEVSVFNRVLGMIAQANGLPRVEMIRLYAMSVLITAVLNPVRTNNAMRDLMAEHETRAWTSLLNDLQVEAV